MANRVPITIRLDAFEGPLDLLLYLIQTHELDISRISLGRITDQYLAYVRLMQELNFDIASEFLVMAATLIHWKSKALLPQEQDPNAVKNAEDEFLSQEDLLRQLQEHQRFLEAGQNLAALPWLGLDTFSRANLKPPRERVWKEMQITDLALCYQDQVTKARKRTQVLKKETVSLSTKIMEFSTRLRVGEITEMQALIEDIQFRPEVVVTFLASLELSRLKKMRLYQEGTYQAIYVELLENLIGFDSRLATGFDAITENIEKDVAASRDAGLHPNAIPDPTLDSLLRGNARAEGDAAGTDLSGATLPGTAGMAGTDEASAHASAVGASALGDGASDHAGLTN